MLNKIESLLKITTKDYYFDLGFQLKQEQQTKLQKI